MDANFRNAPSAPGLQDNSLLRCQAHGRPTDIDALFLTKLVSEREREKKINK